MSASPDTPLLVATGGKENDLKLWDGNRPDAAPIFRAKNVRIFPTIPAMISRRYLMITSISEFQSGLLVLGLCLRLGINHVLPWEQDIIMYVS